MKKFLLATAAVLASTSAYAADYAVVHPFYTPAQGKFVSTTSLDYEHVSTQDKAWDWKTRGHETTLSEELKYGVTNDIQVSIEISRDWMKGKGKDAEGLVLPGTTHQYTNIWGISAGYNILNDGKAFLNTTLSYGQAVGKMKPTWTNDDEHAKFIGLKVFGGYNFDEVTVFGSIGYNRQIDGEKGWAGISIPKSRVYSLEAGAFKAFNDQISAKASLSADIDETKDAEERTYWLNVGADYSLSKKMAVGVNAGYLIDNDQDDRIALPDTHRGYKLGVDFTVEF